jgi:YcaO-like protein with predicted kinase domain
MASAVMEAAEYAIAEQPQSDIRLATVAELQRNAERYFDPHRLLPHAEPLPSGLPIGWVEGRAWPSGERLWLPLDALTIGGEASTLPAISRSTNGLASGNTPPEALFHAICELIERDATSLWSLLSDAARQATEFGIASIDDPAIGRMCQQVEEAELELRLFDQTTDLGVPCVMAVISARATGSARRFDLAAGYGCHPVGVRAISRAITEAAQTRITNIAGGRDDFLPAEYTEGVDDTTAFLEQRSTEADPPAWLPYGTPLPDLLGHLASRIGPVAEIAWAELGGSSYGISVVKALSPALEDRETNAHWRPGKRALRMLIR